MKEKYFVELNDNKYTMPPVCICCGATTSAFRKKSILLASYRGNALVPFNVGSDPFKPKLISGPYEACTYAKIQIAVCGKCEEHDKKLGTRMLWVIIPTVFAGLIFGIPIFINLFNEKEQKTAFIMLLAVSGILLMLFSFYKRFKSKLRGSGHCDESLDNLVDIKVNENNKWIFIFKSQQFTAAFTQLNSDARLLRERPVYKSRK